MGFGDPVTEKDRCFAGYGTATGRYLDAPSYAQLAL